ncbi:MAG: methyltransferase [Myxococcales bacterium]|nr:methyltransferase [Myxococcales bacterium]
MTDASLDASLDPDRLDDALLARWRVALRAAAYDDVFLARCEAIAPRMLDAVRLPVVVWWLRTQQHPAAALARLWAYGDAVDDAALRAALEPGPREGLVDELADAGALHRTDEGWCSALRLLPFAGLLVASDPMHAPDPVMGPGATTQQLVQALGERPGPRVLDVGCGAGSLALVAAARGAAEVVGVDLHPRAARWSRLNAALNGLTLELHTGDLTAPVRGRTFDLVVAQPPFVIKPPDVEATTYLHGGAMGDELTMRLVSELPSVLAPGGEARILFDSPVRAEAPLWRRLQDAHGDDELQQLVFATPGLSPELQAIGYAANGHPALGPAYADAARRYRAHLHAQGIERCEHALAVLRRGSPGLSVTVERASLAGVTDEVIAQTWRAVMVASQPEARLRATTVGLPPEAWLVQEQALDGSEARLILRLPPGRGGDQVLSDAAALLVDQLREPIAVGALVERYASACELSAADVGPGVVDFVRQSLVAGRLVATAEDA